MVRRGGLGEPEAWIEGGEGGATDPRDVRVVEQPGQSPDGKDCADNKEMRQPVRDGLGRTWAVAG